jgi:NDP-sugar pyrophosphorylase family protein
MAGRRRHLRGEDLAGRPRRRALVLAAGLGLRLRPLTEAMPKPLLPVAGTPIICATLDVLASAGVELCAINLHHLPAAIPAALGTSWKGMPLVYRSEPTLLGTLGPLAAFRPELEAAEEIFVVNGDSLCQWPLEQLSRVRRQAGARIALLLSQTADPEPLGGGLGVNARGHLRLVPELDLGGWSRRRVFAGAHALDSRLLAQIPSGPGDSIRQLYRPLLRAGETIVTTATARRWDDLGTPESYRRGILRRLGRRSFVAADAEVARSARVHCSAIEASAQVRSDAHVERSVVLPGATIGSGARVVDAVVGFGAEIPPGAVIEGGCW